MTTSPDILRQRRRLAEEQLTGSSRWRDDLNDDQAQRLLDWALAFVNEAVWQTAVLPPTDAEEALDEAVTAVADLMRQVNDLTASLPQLDDKTTVRRWRTFLKTVQTLTGQPVLTPETEQLVYLRGAWDNEATFAQLYQRIAWEKEEEE